MGFFAFLFVIFAWPYAILPGWMKTSLGKSDKDFFNIPPTAGFVFGLIVDLLIVAGFWFLRQRRTKRDYPRLAGALCCFALPLWDIGQAVDASLRVDMFDSNYGKNTRTVSLGDFSGVDVRGGKFWNGYGYAARVSSTQPESLFFTTEESGREIVRYDIGKDRVKHGIGQKQWQAAVCMPMTRSIERSPRFLKQPPDSADLVIQGKSFHKSAAHWASYLFSPNGSYLALFSIDGEWQGNVSWSQSLRDAKVSLDIYRVRDGVRVDGGRYRSTSQMQPFWLDSRFLVVPLREYGEILLTALPPEPPMPSPLTGAELQESEDAIEDSCPSDANRVSLVDTRGVNTAEGTGLEITVRFAVGKAGPYRYRLLLFYGSGGQIRGEGTAFLKTGEQTLTIPLSAKQLGFLPLEGFQIIKLTLFEQGPFGEIPTVFLPATETWTKP